MVFYFLFARFRDGENILVCILELSCWQCKLRDVEAGVFNYVRFPLRGGIGLEAFIFLFKLVTICHLTTLSNDPILQTTLTRNTNKIINFC